MGRAVETHATLLKIRGRIKIRRETAENAEGGNYVAEERREPQREEGGKKPISLSLLLLSAFSASSLCVLCGFSSNSLLKTRFKEIYPFWSV
jgi:hypothetical protein